MHLLEKERIKQEYLQQLKWEWLQEQDRFPDFLVPVTAENKLENEIYIKKSIKKMKKQWNDKGKLKEKTNRLLDDLLTEETIIGIQTVMDAQTITDFSDELKKMLRWIRSFAPELDFEGIGQAIRNYVVYAMFRELNGLKQDCSPAIFGYSMLYPFTDNFIDNPLHTNVDKQEYNQLIKDKIKGFPVSFVSAHHQKTCELLSEIESNFPREAYSSIYNLLLCMLEAQENSIGQQHQNVTLTQEERLDISLYKGGISVLIDRYFVQKELTEADLHFYLGFGFFLQLADDLQDITEDTEKYNQTIMTFELNSEYAEKTVNRSLYFLQSLFRDYDTENKKFKEFILKNSYQLIFMSVYGSKEHFSDTYLAEMELYFPVSFSFLDKLKEKNKKKEKADKNEYLRFLDEMIKE